MPISSTAVRQGISFHSMPRWSRAAVLLAMTALAGVPSSHVSAEDSILTWIVKQVREDDNIIQASAMQVPQEGAALMTGDQISTGSGQHVVLDNGRDLVEVGPNTTVSIGDNDPSTTEANVDVVSGAIHVEVGKRNPGQTFSIGAPYLLATVKGTKFDVSTSSETSAVSVTEGVVAVSSAATGYSVDVTAGNTAVVGQRSTDTPTLVPTPAGGAPSVIGGPGNLDSASANTGGGLGGEVGGAVGGAVGGSGGAVGGAAKAAGDAVGGATGAVGGALGGGVGGALGGLGGALGGNKGKD